MNAYTYLIGWTTVGKFYYGSQYGKSASPKNLWKTYFTSSKHVSRFRDIHGEPDVICVRRTFGTDGGKCRAWEERVLTRVSLTNDGRWLNKKVANKKWFHQPGQGRGIPKSEEHKKKIGDAHRGKTLVYDKNSEKYILAKSEDYYTNPCYIHPRTGVSMSAEMKSRLSFFNLGKTHTEESRKKISKAMIGKNLGVPRGEETKKKISDKLRGRVSAVDVLTGERITVDKNTFDADPNLIGQTSGIGKPHTDESRKKISNGQRGMFTAYDIVTCAYRRVTREEFDGNPNLKGSRYVPR